MKLIRIKEVLEMISVSKSTIWQWVKDGKFPPPIKQGRCTFWLLEDIQKHFEAKNRI